MIDRIGKIFLALVLLAAVLLGAYLGFLRFIIETQNRSVEIVLDLNDLKKAAAFEKRPLGPILDEIRKIGINEIGVFEETLSDASLQGELLFLNSAGVLRVANTVPAFNRLATLHQIKADKTYLYLPNETVRRRIYGQLKLAVGEKTLKFLGRDILQVDEQADELRTLGLGISESQKKYLEEKGFTIVPRVWNDPHYHLGNIEGKVSWLNDYGMVIFDGEEILGYPDALPELATGLTKNNIKYGYVEIVKQDGDLKLKKMMGESAVRVHSVPKDELKKINQEESLDRFVRAVRERSVRVIYLRPFLPPQIDAFPVEYNVKYFQAVVTKLQSAGFVIAKAEKPQPLQVAGWQIVLLGCGVIVGLLTLLNYFVPIRTLPMIGLLLFGAIFIILSSFGYQLVLQKSLVLTAALVFPSLAVIQTLSRSNKLFGGPAMMIVNILAETSIGIFIMIGLLADYRFMSGIELFPAVKIALSVPLLIVACYFILRSETGNIKDVIQKFLTTKISVLTVGLGLFVIGALGLLVARSGNFIIPVPGFEKYLRNWLEVILFVRPRTKEFLVGYPALYLAAVYYLRGKTQWLWLLAAIGAIAPVSVFNTFSHIHTPLMVSLTRTFNGLVLGLLVGMLVWFIVDKVTNKK
ncbi:MAG: DUF5693 family protein [Candidatus Margulisbacteria bacterium]|nr:DUF5693 family protein [Candidatus Margulisiibacteriota bacterium]